MSSAPTEPTPKLLGNIRQLIEVARQQTSVAFSACQTALYCRISCCMHTELLAGERPAYGAQIVATMSRQLVHDAVALSSARMDHRSGGEV